MIVYQPVQQWLLLHLKMGQSHYCLLHIMHETGKAGGLIHITNEHILNTEEKSYA